MYINNLGDLMCDDDKARLYELIPKEAVEKLFFGLRSRFRPLISAVEEIITKGRMILDKVAKDPAMFKDAVDLKHVLRQTVVSRASLGLSWSLQGEESILVKSAFARLLIAADQAATEKLVKTIIDELFVFQAAYNFNRREDEVFYNFFREQY
ncbi:hypothetical protein BGW38_001928 [Lunasporangiospora selenospora]|uniref:Uncharacterized protein n=1 Tax=Lunasporangiospora selenospora TaxID=979761 RepID=A0A9P6FT95_9FUNG|nr:hypothetical protein BGW38_001928 [Lunasporangiospora selenospora]